MNQNKPVISLRPDNIIDDEAAQWLMKLDQGTLSSQERAAFKQWMSADEKHAVALKSMAIIWQDLDTVLNESVTREEIKFPAIVNKNWSVGLAFSTVAIALAFSWLFFYAVDQNTYLTATGQQLEMTLTDGSVVHLNTNSLIKTEYSRGERIVRLLKGEALFEVAHDKQRPFIVYVGNRQVRALGTKFVVHLDSENIQVIVTDGKVQLSRSSNKEVEDSVVIAKGEQAVVVENTLPMLTKVAEKTLNNELAWLDGKLIFDNEKLVSVIAEISRYIDVNIIIDDPSLNDIHVSGRFDLGDTSALIEAIELSLNVQSTHIDSHTILLTK